LEPSQQRPKCVCVPSSPPFASALIRPNDDKAPIWLPNIRELDQQFFQCESLLPFDEVAAGLALLQLVWRGREVWPDCPLQAEQVATGAGFCEGIEDIRRETGDRE
jgi:hypothetical protein